MTERWTRDQARAITTLDRDVFVSAGAGTGKTAVLVEHALEILRSGTSPERLLVITFTRKAADQLREKLFGALTASEAKLRALLPLLPRAYISTVHAFCNRLLRESAVEAGVDPSFRVLDETATDLLVKESISEVLDRWYEDVLEEKVDPRFGTLVDLCQRMPDGIDGELRMLLDMARTTEDPQRTLGILEQRDSLPYREHYERLAEEDLSQIHRCAQALAGALERQHRLTKGARSLLEAAGKLTGVSSRFRDSWQARQALLDCGVISLEQGRWKRTLPGAKKLSAEAKEPYEALKDALKHSVLDHLPPTKDDLLAQERHVSIFGGILTRLLREIQEVYGDKKRSRGVLDFADLELMTKEFLEREQAAGMDPSRRYDHVLVDEFQDINRLQARIIELLTVNNRRFLVGDIKQCIYQFRQSAPDIFRDLLQEREPTESARASDQGDLFAQSGKGLVVRVRDSFRSRNPILSFVNRIFAEIFKEESLGIPYTDQELRPGLDYRTLGSDPPPDPTVLVNIIHPDPLKPAGEKEEDPENAFRARSVSEREAMLVAKTIRRLVCQEKPRIWDKETREWRELRWGDIAVLLRSPRPTWGHTFLSVLRQEGIPVHLGRGMGFFDAEEIRDATNLLRVLDNAFNDIPLAALLRSPIFGWRDDDLALLRHMYPEAQYLWLALQQVATGGNGKEPIRTQRLPSDVEAILLGAAGEIPKRMRQRLERICREAAAKLEDWRGRLGQGELESTLASILHEAKLPQLVTAHPQGHLRQANLHKLLDLFQSYARDHGHSLRGLLAWLDEVRLETEPLAQIPGEAEEGNTVRILSVHMAKGLEFPFVVIAQLGQKLPLFEHLRSPILGTPEGLGMDLLKPREFEKVPTLAHWTLRAVKKRTEVFEEMRVLYVAATRARERLILVGSVGNRWLTETRSLPLRPQDLWSPPGRSALTGWILPILAQHPMWPGNESLSNEEAKTLPWSLQLHVASELDRAFPVHPLDPRPSKTCDLVARNEPLPVKGPSSGRLQQILAPIRMQYPVPWLRSYQGRYWVTELKRWTDRWREAEAHEEGSRLPMLPDEWTMSWSASLLGLLGRAPARPGGEPAEPESREIGQALHLVLEKLDLATPARKVSLGQRVTAPDLREAAAGVLQKHGLPPSLVSDESTEWIADFFNCDLGRALLEAWREDPHNVDREASFTLRLPLSELHRILSAAHEERSLIPGWPGAQAKEEDLSREWTLLQGQMDLLWRGLDGTWLLLDYKSDRITPDALPERVRAYTPQIRLYELAARRLWDAHPLRSYLYFLRLGRAVEISQDVDPKNSEVKP